jgi:hypothetical protein
MPKEKGYICKKYPSKKKSFMGKRLDEVLWAVEKKNVNGKT